jgi:UDP-glucose 4-epimerase
MSPTDSQTILVTGGLGYIGSHTALALLARNHRVVIVDNLSNSKRSVLGRLEQLSGCAIPFYDADIRDEAALGAIFARHPIDSVIHFAALKSPAESIAQPLRYYDNNVHGSLCLFRAMADHGVYSVVFSSSANVYGDPASVPVRETFPLQPTNPYGQSKMMCEMALEALAKSDARWKIAILRYFNPVGAHESGMIGEDPDDIPNNLVPYLSQVAAGVRDRLSIWGNDYPTPDGTGVRDYIHVQDLAEGHLAALAALRRTDWRISTVNLGTGRGYSVLEMLHAFERASGRKISYQFAPRRPGDSAQCYADPSLAGVQLNWTAKRTLDDMCRDAWRWQQNVERLK